MDNENILAATRGSFKHIVREMFKLGKLDVSKWIEDDEIITAGEKEIEYDGWKFYFTEKELYDFVKRLQWVGAQRVLGEMSKNGLIDIGFDGEDFIYLHKKNPAQHVPVMGYAAAHRWESMAKARGVSAVARSGRGFMRAYERAGTWARLDPWWKARRNAFVARHMAQVRLNGEKLWKRDRGGKLQPSRRGLALLMWAYLPPR